MMRFRPFDNPLCKNLRIHVHTLVAFCKLNFSMSMLFGWLMATFSTACNGLVSALLSLVGSEMIYGGQQFGAVLGHFGPFRHNGSRSNWSPRLVSNCRVVGCHHMSPLDPLVFSYLSHTVCYKLFISFGSS